MIAVFSQSFERSHLIQLNAIDVQLNQMMIDQSKKIPKLF